MSRYGGRGRGNKPQARGGRGISQSTPWGGRGISLSNFPPLSQSVLGSTNPFSHLGEQEAPSMVDLQEFLNKKNSEFSDFMKQKKGGNKPSSSSGNKPATTAASILRDKPVYKTGTYSEPIMAIDEDFHSWVNDPEYCKKQVLSIWSHYPSPHQRQRSQYEAMLTTTDSVEIRHFYRDSKPSQHILYSHCYIKRILTKTDWENMPLQTKAFRLPHDRTEYSFNFWDYLDAWKFTFFYENENNSHSWFFRVREEFWEKQKIIPLWFYQWWRMFGPPLSLLPKPVQDLYDPWAEVHPIISDLNKKSYGGQPIFYFWAEFGIPWIWKWGVKIEEDELGIPILIRTTHFNWWTRVDVPDLVTNIKKVTTAYGKTKPAEAGTSESRKDYWGPLRKSLERRFPAASEYEIMLKCLEHFQGEFRDVLSPSQSPMSLDSRSKKSAESDDDEPVLAGESQNPDDDVVSTSDILSSALELLKEKSKGKGKAD